MQCLELQAIFEKKCKGIFEMIIKELRKKIGEDKVAEVFDSLLKTQLMPIKYYTYEIESLKDRYEKIDRDINLGILPFVEAQLKKNTLNNSLLALLDELDRSAKSIELIISDLNVKLALYRKRMFTQLNRVDNVLYIEEDIDLNQIFYPFKLNSKGKNLSPDIIFNNDNPNSHIILTGEAGSGKTTLLKHVFIRELNKKESLPIFLWFSKFIQEITDFEDFLIDHISDISGANRVDVKILLRKVFFL